MCLVRGMIAQTVLRQDPAYYAEMLAFWKAQVACHFPEEPPAAAAKPKPIPKPRAAMAAKRSAPRAARP